MQFHEYEAALAWGYTLGAWSVETPVNRAKCVAHWLHRNLRDAFSAEAAMSKGDKKEGAHGYNDLMKSMGLQ